MPPTRRSFFTQLAAAGVVAPAWLASAGRAAEPGAPVDVFAPGLAAAVDAAGRIAAAMAGASSDPTVVAADEPRWAEVQASWAVDRTILNLENGGVQPSPAVVNHAYLQAWLASHEAPAHSLNRVLWPQVEGVRTRLAAAFGCDPEEMALTRNTTEGIETVLLGLRWTAGDEVVTTTQDYWRFQNTLRQRAERDGIVVRQISLPVPAESADEMVARFAAAITPRTRAILLSQVINLTGQFLPVREIVQLARARGVLVVVDGAHGFAHVPLTRDSLDCDIYATSLHKWLGAPHGTGFLYVRRERIAEIWPLFPAPAELRGNIRKFESIGTVPAAPYLAIREALDFWASIGAARKAARLRWLRERWLAPLAAEPWLKVHTPRQPELAGALATVACAGLPPTKLAAWLWERHRTLVRPIIHPEFQGIRVTPNLYTTPADLERFVALLKAAATKGLG
jgi:selenocysteine lyase/cysteine desulfurase